MKSSQPGFPKGVLKLGQSQNSSSGITGPWLFKKPWAREIKRAEVALPPAAPTARRSGMQGLRPRSCGPIKGHDPHIHTFIHTSIHPYHYITDLTLRSIALQITLHYITLHYITLHCIALHYIALHYITYMHRGAGGESRSLPAAFLELCSQGESCWCSVCLPAVAWNHSLRSGEPRVAAPLHSRLRFAERMILPSASRCALIPHERQWMRLPVCQNWWLLWPSWGWLYCSSMQALFMKLLKASSLARLCIDIPHLPHLM